MNNKYEVFIQNYYPESPLTGMTGTREFPCYYLGILHVSGQDVIGMEFAIPGHIIMAMFHRKFVNIYIPDAGLLRNVEFSTQKTNFKSLISGSCFLPSNEVE